MFFISMTIFLLLMVAFLVLLERKILSLSQNRKGPNMVSVYSILQTIMDSIKLLLKGFLVLPFFTSFFFYLAPFLTFFLSLSVWFFPFIYNSFSYMEMSIFLFLVIMSLNSHTLVWAGWSSTNIYSLISAVRAVAQVISYEVVLSFFFFLLFFKTGKMSWGVFSSSSFFFFFFFFFLWVVIMLAELNRTPFDLVEGESELVSSYNVEFSGASFTLLFLAEYLSIWLMSLLLVIFFTIYKVVFFLFFVMLVVFLRAQLPRFKFFDLISLVWKVLLIYITLFLVFFFIF